MRSIKRSASFCLFLFVLLFCGCSSEKTDVPKTTFNSPRTVSEPSNPSGTPLPASDNISSDFTAFLDEVFRDYASSDSLSLHYTLQDPEALKIERKPVTLGTFSEAELRSSDKTAKDYLARLHTFSKEALDISEQFLYDLLEYALENSVLPEGTALYDTPLGPTTGLQTQLPVLLAEYRFSTLSDVEDYFLLLADLPNYFDDICAFEEARSAADTQACAEVLSRILLQCEAFIENPGDNFLIESFRDRLSVLPDLDAAEIAELCMRNQNLIFTKVIPAYEKLITTLTALTNTSVPAAGLSSLPNGTAYYEYLVRSNTGSDKSVEELEDILETALLEHMLTMITLYESESLRTELQNFQKDGLAVRPESAAANQDTKKKNGASMSVSALSDTLLSRLQEQILADFPQPADASCRVQTIHPSLEDFISPALYLVPPLDGYTENVIYINQEKCSLSGLFSTLAHEGYPGHLYQNTYFAATSPHPIRMLLNFTGYDEGWGTYAELFSYQYADCSEELRRFLVAEQVAALCLYSLSDIRIHYHGANLEDIVSFLQNYGLSAESAEELYYTQLAEPAIYLPYSVGYLEICALRDYYFSLEGSAASLLPFHTFLLETGPAPFSLLREQLQKEFQ